MDGINSLLGIWFGLTAISVLYMSYDLFTRTPAMKVMKWGWLLVALYTGPVALLLYVVSCREPAPGTHEKFIAPLWKQAIGSTIHCLAGDATGIIVAASITLTLGLPMGLDSIVEYVSGFAFGLLIFQALFMKGMLGGSYGQAVRATWLSEWLSMNAVMAGMIPVMVILMSHDMRSMNPLSLRFWGIMSLATLIGAVLAYPVNWWLVKRGLKHGMGTERALGRCGAKQEVEAQAAPHKATDSAHLGMPGMPRTDSAGEQPTASMEHKPPHVSQLTLVLMTALTLTLLAIGVALAGSFGDFNMRDRPMVTRSSLS